MLDITADTRILKIDGVLRVYNSREPGSIIYYGDTIKHHELIFKLSGDSISRISGREYSLSEGSVFYLPQGWKGDYSVETLHKGEAIDIWFKTDTPLASEPIMLPPPHRPNISELFKKCHETWRVGNESKQIRCLSLSYSILSELHDEAHRQYATSRVRIILETAIHFLNEHCFEPDIDYLMLSRLTEVSYSYLKKLFVAQYGIPPSRYVIRKRMEYAKTLLMTPELSVTDVSRQVGYSSVYYFSRVFREETGMSPSEYRRIM